MDVTIKGKELDACYTVFDVDQQGKKGFSSATSSVLPVGEDISVFAAP